MGDCYSTNDADQGKYDNVARAITGLVDWFKRYRYPAFATCVIDTELVHQATKAYDAVVIPSPKRVPDGPDMVFRFHVPSLFVANDVGLQWMCDRAFSLVEPVLRPDGSQVFDAAGRPRLRRTIIDTETIPVNISEVVTIGPRQVLIEGKRVRVPADYPQTF